MGVKNTSPSGVPNYSVTSIRLLSTRLLEVNSGSRRLEKVMMTGDPLIVTNTGTNERKGKGLVIYTSDHLISDNSYSPS